jgi:hypothetical protein
MQRQANSVISGSDSAKAWHRPANWVGRMSCGRVVLAVGIWYCTSSTLEQCCSGSRRDLVQWVIWLGDLDTHGSVSVIGSCGVSLSTLGEIMS